MTRRTHTWNAWQTTITAELASGASSIAVPLIPAEFTAPMYLVVEPAETGQKEWIKADTINGNTFENLTRNLDGSDGDLTHPINSVIRLVLSKQHLDDIFLDIEDNTADIATNVTDITLRVAKAGDTMTGELTVPVAAPSGDAIASNKKYVDDTVGAISTDHDDLTNVTTAQHHTKYTDAEAVAAVLADDTSKNLVDTDYTTLETDQAITHASNDPHTITLHDASTRPFQGLIIYKSGGTGTLTVVAGGGQDIGYEGPPITSIQLVDPGDSVSLLSQGFDAWFAVSLNGTFVPL